MRDNLISCAFLFNHSIPIPRHPYGGCERQSSCNQSIVNNQTIRTRTRKNLLCGILSNSLWVLLLTATHRLRNYNLCMSYPLKLSCTKLIPNTQQRRTVIKESESSVPSLMLVLALCCFPYLSESGWYVVGENHEYLGEDIFKIETAEDSRANLVQDSVSPHDILFLKILINIKILNPVL